MHEWHDIQRRSASGSQEHASTRLRASEERSDSSPSLPLRRKSRRRVDTMVARLEVSRPRVVRAQRASLADSSSLVTAPRTRPHRGEKRLLVHVVGVSPSLVARHRCIRVSCNSVCRAHTANKARRTSSLARLTIPSTHSQIHVTDGYKAISSCLEGNAVPERSCIPQCYFELRSPGMHQLDSSSAATSGTIDCG